MGYFNPAEILESLNGYTTDFFIPQTPRHWKAPLDYPGAFGLAECISKEAVQRFSNQGVYATTLEKVLLSQGLRTAVYYPVILEPAVAAGGRVITPDHRNGHVMEPRVMYAFLNKKISLADIQDLLEGIDVRTIL
ncbi:MAG: hypothetical protein Q7R96_05750 [Nanoarchaeota archaeon]|nr:hypothetical protein [Nanoarchaeota archaeon]